MAGVGRILLGGVVVIGALGTVALHAQTQLEDPRNAAKIFASNCSACHKSPQGLGKNGSASFLRQHYTTGAEMSSAMASYLASAGSGPAPSKKTERAEKAEKKEAPATKTAAKRESGGHPFTDGSTDTPRPMTWREKQKAKAEHKQAEPKQAEPRQAARSDPPPAVVERPPQASAMPAAPSAAASASTPSAAGNASASIGVSAAAAPAARATEEATPAASLYDIPLPEFPSEPPPELNSQPPVFSTAPLP